MRVIYTYISIGAQEIAWTRTISSNQRNIRTMSAATIFNETIPARLQDADQRSSMMEVGAVFQFNLTGDEEGTWCIDLKEGACTAGEHDDADCTITIDSADFVDLYNGETQGAALFMQGKIQIEGNMGLALKLDEIMG